MNGKGWWTVSHRGTPRWLIALATLLAVMVAGLAAVVLIGPTADSDDRAAPVAVFLGDSYTAGTGASTPANRWPQLVGAALGWDVRVYARGGTGFTRSVDGVNAERACGKSYCESFLEAISLAAAADPDIVVISGGRNDASLEEDAAAEAVTDVMESVQEQFPDAEILVTNPLWDDDSPPQSLRALSATLEAETTRIGGRYLDLGQPLGGREELVIDDGVHPDDEGHQVIADAFLAVLRS